MKYYVGDLSLEDLFLRHEMKLLDDQINLEFNLYYALYLIVTIFPEFIDFINPIRRNLQRNPELVKQLIRSSIYYGGFHHDCSEALFGQFSLSWVLEILSGRSEEHQQYKKILECLLSKVAFSSDWARPLQYDPCSLLISSPSRISEIIDDRYISVGNILNDLKDQIKNVARELFGLEIYCIDPNSDDIYEWTLYSDYQAVGLDESKIATFLKYTVGLHENFTFSIVSSEFLRVDVDLLDMVACHFAKHLHLENFEKALLNHLVNCNARG